LLVRLRLPGGRVQPESLAAVIRFAERYGDGRVRVTTRSNLQVRGLPAAPGTERLADDVLADLERTGLLPSRAHDLARNVMASPQTGLTGGRADVRPVVAALDAAICADPALAGLPGRFLFVLDDGRGDLLERSCDLGLVALDAHRAQVRVGAGWGPVVPLAAAPGALVTLAREFLSRRGSGPAAAWHVTELDHPLTDAHPPDQRLPSPAPPLPYGEVPGGFHQRVPDGGLDRAAVSRLTDASVLIVTPWRGVLIPEET